MNLDETMTVRRDYYKNRNKEDKNFINSRIIVGPNKVLES